MIVSSLGMFGGMGMAVSSPPFFFSFFSFQLRGLYCIIDCCDWICCAIFLYTIFDINVL